MQPKVKVTLSVFTFVAMVLTGLAAAEQVPTKNTGAKEPLLSPSIISLSPKLVQGRSAVHKEDSPVAHPDSVAQQTSTR